MDLLDQPVTYLSGIAEKNAIKLKSLDIYTIGDLIRHFPQRYHDKTKIYPIADIVKLDEALIQGVIRNVSIWYYPKLNIIIDLIDQSCSSIQIKFFRAYVHMIKLLQVGREIRCFGKLSFFKNKLQMIHPEFKVISSHKNIPLCQTLTPIYASVSGISQKQLQQWIKQAFAYCANASFYSLDFFNFCRMLHFPSPKYTKQDLKDRRHPAIKQLAFEELLAYYLSFRQIRQQSKQYQAYPLKITSPYQDLFDNLNFQLTNAQKKVMLEIANDLGRTSPMMRLIQGDVSCGKTIVAFYAIAHALSNHHCQVAFMAPTEILAKQHVQNFEQLFPEQNYAFYTGQLTVKQKRRIKQGIKEGEIHVVIGTHAIFQEDVQFKSLALIIIDEQHRFGVEQRVRLWQKGCIGQMAPHHLTLTATPIPRTLALVLYADKDFSVIDELPLNRYPITTVVLSQNKREELTQHIKKICDDKEQVYWVCPLIEESEILEIKAAERAYTELQQWLPYLNIAWLHGKMTSDKKEQIIYKFKQNQFDILVATTVIEVGVDVPNATLMVIENAERLGLAQLHQLRGRVGRSMKQSFCVLLYQPGLSKRAQARLNVMRKTQNGFKIAEKDLSLRGPGELCGLKQAGLPQFRVADMTRDAYMLKDVKKKGETLISSPKRVEHILKHWLTNHKDMTKNLTTPMIQ